MAEWYLCLIDIFVILPYSIYMDEETKTREREKTMNKTLYALIISLFMVVAIGTSVEAKTAPKPAVKKPAIVKVVVKPVVKKVAVKPVVKVAPKAPVKAPEKFMSPTHIAVAASDPSTCTTYHYVSVDLSVKTQWETPGKISMDIPYCYDGSSVWLDDSTPITCTNVYTEIYEVNCGYLYAPGTVFNQVTGEDRSFATPDSNPSLRSSTTTIHVGMRYETMAYAQNAYVLLTISPDGTVGNYWQTITTR